MLKALIDRLLQDGMEELLQELTTSRRVNEKEKHGSNIITDYTVCTQSMHISSTLITPGDIPSHLVGYSWEKFNKEN